MPELRQREPRVELPALRATARGAPCMLRIASVCNGNPETTVWCHSNQDRHGKGKGLKAHDCFGAFGCSACHAWLDNQVPNVPHAEKVEAFEVGRDRTLLYLFKHGHLKVVPRPIPAGGVAGSIVKGADMAKSKGKKSGGKKKC